MRTPKVWIARVGNFRFPGHWGHHPAPGELTLSCELSEAGTHTGRSVDVVIPADKLEVIASMVASAIVVRDDARARAARTAGLPGGA